MPISKTIAAILLIASAVEAQQSNGSPVDQRIQLAEKQLKATPNTALALNGLAFALIRKGRDVQDDSVYRQADKLLDQSLKQSAGNYDAQKLRVAELLGLDEPAEALKLAKDLNHKVPDDTVVWALLVDADVALGNYDQAEKAAQWVLDLRPGSSLGFEKAAELREWFGDTEGAIEFFEEANRRTSQNDIDQKAWLLTQRARLLLDSGNVKGADQVITEALRLFPDSQLAASVVIRIRLAEKNFAEAVSVAEQRYKRVPSSSNLYDWAETLDAAARNQDASLQFANFEKQARGEAPTRHDAALKLVAYYADKKSDTAAALTVAQAEIAKRQDSPTLAAYAWALYRNGKFSEAKIQMDKALAVGVRNPVYLSHAESISNMVKPLSSLSEVKP